MTPFTKIIFWAACTLIWNGLLRVHETLSRLQLEFDSQTIFMHDHVQILSEEINIEKGLS